MAGSWHSRGAGLTTAVSCAFLLVGLSAAVASGTAEPLRPALPVVRLGDSTGYVTIGGVTKPVTATSAAPVTVDMGRLSPGRLHVGAAISPQWKPEDDTATCEVHGPGDGQALATLHLQPRRWTVATVPVDAPDGGRLLMRCEGSGGRSPEITWARPILVPTLPGRGAPLVVLVSLDTLRADYVTGFGAPDGLTPALGRLGRDGMRFTDTTADGTWTIPSHFAIFYGRLYGFPSEKPPIRGLAQLLAEHGYVAAGLTGGGFVSAFFRFHLGFDHFAEYDARDYGGSDIRSLPRVLDDARELIDRFADAPTFLFLHTYAVHEITPVEVRWAELHRDWQAFVPTSPAQVAEARALYERRVRETDVLLASLFERLRVLAATRPVLLVVTSDHGEAFGEHGNFRHGDEGDRVTLHDEVVHIPMIVWGSPHVAVGAVSRRPTMLSDVAPSILAAVGVPRPAYMTGESLEPYWSTRDGAERDRSIRQPPSVTRGSRGWTLRTPSYKLIVEARAGGAPHVELYALRRDAAQRQNLATRHPRAVAGLSRRLSRRVAALTGVHTSDGVLPGCPLCSYKQNAAFWDLMVGSPTPVASSEVDDEMRERLRALGYVQP